MLHLLSKASKDLRNSAAECLGVGHDALASLPQGSVGIREKVVVVGVPGRVARASVGKGARRGGVAEAARSKLMPGSEEARSE